MAAITRVPVVQPCSGVTGVGVTRAATDGVSIFFLEKTDVLSGR